MVGQDLLDGDSSDMVEGVVRIPEDWSDCLVKATQTAIDGTPYVFTLGVC
jgi:hypothetical protein